jgi:hypothetical protein
MEPDRVHPMGMKDWNSIIDALTPLAKDPIVGPVVQELINMFIAA